MQIEMQELEHPGIKKFQNIQKTLCISTTCDQPGCYRLYARTIVYIATKSLLLLIVSDHHACFIFHLLF